ncbi:non-ribosomal peptide synthetase [Brasilonema octagenarum UFV-E1]|uniref:Non-ribosomal peptide synthetase n=1 Tax=Brasilonema sennae CENA114 TaxID=415709 RepID=A0A856MMP7_9CYAN|nr:non-ribosomal peptide synthetase [Brasilonema sennae]QDL10791.1 non-ribosomal peptide synthetase [Brasilonema sennae CENA114]QDL17137.1 non-ribosomal peptide synthetase [Brasilonema octagenarum UFV-E1]
MQAESMEGFQLSPQQEHLWLLQQLDQSEAYRSNCAILIEGHVNINNLELALQDIVDRHEILRTCFPCLPGMTLPVQVIKNRKLKLETKHNLCSLSPQQQEAKIEAIFQQFNQLSFDYEQGSILQTSLISLSPEKHLFFIGLPALCGDHASLNNLVKEIAIFYSEQAPDELSEEPLQYADFSEWQNQILEAEETAVGRKYWSKQDFSGLRKFQLPFENSISVKPKFEPKLVISRIEPELIEKIEVLAQKYNTSASIFYLTCWLILLWRLIGQSEMIVGKAVDGRKYDELKKALGLFAKYLPLHCDLQENLRFRQILQEIHESVESIYKWQEGFTWEQISSDTKSENLPFLPFGFDFESEEPKYFADNIAFSIYKRYTCIERFKIKLSCRQRDDFLSTEFHYDSNLFCAKDIESLAEQFHKLVESAVNHPEAAISELEILSDRHLHQLLVEFNQTQADYPQDKCIHCLFEEQAERTPNNIAVTFSDEKLTYGELNIRANKIAHYLQRLGVKPDVLVGICVERALEMIVGILGILKAGGAYVPLDPAYPKERLAFVLEDTQTPVLLTQQRLQESLPAHNAQTICLDTDWETIAQESEENPALKTCPENLAYVIYTSGSTGKPKGVQIAHQNLVHSTTARITYYQETVTSFLLLSSFAFDSSVAGIFWTLCSGGTLCLPQEGLQLEIPKLVELIVQNHVSHLLSLPSLYALLLEETKSEQLTSLRSVIVAGESCPTELVQRHYQLLSETSLFNEYGPTEGTVWSSVYHCPSGKRKAHATRTQSPTEGNPPSALSHHSQQTRKQVSIGSPITNTQIYILDSDLRPVPICVIGEVYISGDGLARGYLNQPALTSEKFIPNPFGDAHPGMRLYKTGDSACYLSDGNIEFLGRLDHQVKIRGYRIELGEIEAVLSQHPQVRESVVIAREDVRGDKRLVGYMVLKRESALTITELRHFLEEKLPDYMLPSAFVLLKELPLTPNGKVDRQALPAPEQVRSEFTGIFVAPRTPVEVMLAEIWAEVLKVERVSIYDNFFDLGGHSLLITQLLVKVQKIFQVDVSLRSLLERPTVAGIAENIENICSYESSPTVNSKTFVDLNAEAVLDPTIFPETFNGSVSEPACILLTGATGFLGAFLLSELLQQTKADIYCLVRSQNVDESKQKLQSCLKAYSLWNESLSSRIIPVVGNLSEPLLGLEEEQFQLMERKIDVIYHNGAWVNHIYPYSVLKAANVLGTQEVLRLASKIKAKPVHFISASSVFSSVGYSGVKLVREQDSLDDGQLLSNGYSQSKWVAEKLVKTAGERGLPVCIYRPSRISGHSQTGVFNTNDFLYRLIIGCIQLGSVPDRDIRENIVPVDYVSKAIVHLSRQEKSLGKAFHLVNPQLLHSSMLIDQICSQGYPIKQMTYEDWRAELLNMTKSSQKHPLYSLVPFFASSNAEEKTSPSAVLHFACENTLNGLAGTSIVCPPINNQLLSTYFSYLIQKGFIDGLQRNIQV